MSLISAGKSFLLNRMMHQLRRESGVRSASNAASVSQSSFPLGSQVDAMTRGLWLNCDLLRSGDLAVLMLDTEGFAADANEMYDAKVFSVASLLSSVLLFNTVKMIDQTSVDSVEMLSRRAQLFALRAHLRGDDAEDGGTESPTGRLPQLEFPTLIWVCEDFVQDLSDTSADEWLSTLLDRPHHRVGPQSDDTNMRTSLRSIFPRIHARTLFLPHTDRETLMHLERVRTDKELTADYRSDLRALTNLAFDDSILRPKTSGKGLVSMLRWLVSSVNQQDANGLFPQVPSIWQAFMAAQIKVAEADVVAHLEKAMHAKYFVETSKPRPTRQQLPNSDNQSTTVESAPRDGSHAVSIVSIADFKSLESLIELQTSPSAFRSFQETAVETSRSQLLQMLVGWEETSACQTALEELRADSVLLMERYQTFHQKLFEEMMRRLHHLIHEQMEAKMVRWHRQKPTASSALMRQQHGKLRADAMEQWSKRGPAFKEYRDIFTTCDEDFTAAIDLTLQRAFTSGVGRMHQLLKDLLADRTADLKRALVAYETPRGRAVFEKYVAERKSAEIAEWNKHTTEYTAESILPSLREQHLRVIVEHVSHLHRRNDELVTSRIRSTRDAASVAFDRAFQKELFQKLPMEEAAFQVALTRLLEGRLERDFDELLRRDGELTDSEEYPKSRAILVDEKQADCRTANKKAIAAVFSAPLERTKRQCVAAAKDFSFANSFATHCEQLARVEIESHMRRVTTFLLDLDGPLAEEVIGDFVKRDLLVEMQRISDALWFKIYCAIGVAVATLALPVVIAAKKAGAATNKATSSGTKW